MKNKRTIIVLALVLLVILGLALYLILGNGSKKENTAPTISGAADMTVEAGSSIDVMAGLKAADEEDGDLTARITVESSPKLTFRNGKATPETAGDYELVYTVADQGGLTAETYATLTVTRQTAKAEVYKTFDFAAAPAPDAHGWEARIGESAQATGEMKQGAFVFDIMNPGDGDGAVQLALPGYALTQADYKVKIWAKSTKDTYCHFLVRDELAEGWATYAGAFNVKIGQEIAPIELSFSCEGEGSAELLLNLGKITPNPDNAADTTPADFTVTIDKIELYEITGEEALIPTYTTDLTAADAVTVEAGDGAAASFADGVVTIENYPTSGGVWSIKANLGLGGQTIASGTKYSYSFTVNAENGLNGECLVESLSQYHEARAHFNGLNAAAGEDVVISGTFTADRDIEDPVIRLQIGNAPEGASANKITVKDLVFGKVEGDKETRKTIHSFGASIAASANPEFPFTTYNGTDEDNERGVGVIWTEGGHFFYRIDQGGMTDWHNKLICGFRENPLTLASDSYYTVEITAKASKPVSCGVFLNPIGGWDPRISAGMDLTTQEQTFTFTTTDTFVIDMDFELLFQFGSPDLANLGEVTIEISNITISQMKVM